MPSGPAEPQRPLWRSGAASSTGETDNRRLISPSLAAAAAAVTAAKVGFSARSTFATSCALAEPAGLSFAALCWRTMIGRPQAERSKTKVSFGSLSESMRNVAPVMQK
jgi:hypothetical protein